MASPKSVKYDKKLKSVLGRAGYQNLTKLTSSLQGSVWSATQSVNNKPIIIKVTDKSLHERSITKLLEDQKSYECQENILKEASILKYLTTQKTAPKSIVKFVDFLESNKNYYLVMENGGHCLFDFVIKAHHMISAGVIEIEEWHRVSKIIFKQMMEAIDFLHLNNVCHFDISLENFLINDVDVIAVKTPNGREQIRFCCDDIQIKLCDFGLAEKVPSGDFGCNKYVGKMNYRSPEIMHKKGFFNGKSNDIWCLGVCLYALIIGSQPFKTAHKTDACFRYIINGQLNKLLKEWNQLHYVDQDLLDLFQAVFQAEERRIDLMGIQKHSWLRE